MEFKPKIVLLAGPTASGKSKLAIDLAKIFDGEIINADSMQVYKELKILTSRPSKSDLKKVKHHLYGFVSVKKNFSVGKWLNLTTKKIKSILKKGKIPILVGGTGLYFKTLISGLVKIPHISKDKKEKIRKYHKKIGQKKFYKELIKLDPKAKKFILQSDTQRSLRAYEVIKYTKKSLYDWMEKTRPIFEEALFEKFFVNSSKNILLKKINTRVEKMFEIGADKEVKNFVALNVNSNLSPNKIIGVQEIRDYLDKKLTLQETKDLVKIRTRQYAKRQFTWARGQMGSWQIINPKNYKDILDKLVN